MIDDIVVIILKDIFIVLGIEVEFEGYIVVLGYLGWFVGQLEVEFIENLWLIIEVDFELIFNMFVYEKW